MQTHLERTIMNSVIELNANKITTSVWKFTCYIILLPTKKWTIEYFRSILNNWMISHLTYCDSTFCFFKEKAWIFFVSHIKRWSIIHISHELCLLSICKYMLPVFICIQFNKVGWLCIQHDICSLYFILWQALWHYIYSYATRINDAYGPIIQYSSSIR
jgi:hypothetical protein